jgi:heme/copper-type cytochrome/quinol oxidase subunit 2
MKKNIVYITLAIILAVAFWFGVLAQKERVSDSAVVNEKTNTEELLPVTNTRTEAEDDQNTDFGTDLGMELPIPESDEPRELGTESAPVEVLEEVYDKPNEKTTFVYILNGENFNFVDYYEDFGKKNPTLRVREGDSVRLELRSLEGNHDLVIDELGVKSEVVGPGESTLVTFIATKPGTYEYYCSVGSHRARGMSGTFIVE